MLGSPGYSLAGLTATQGTAIVGAIPPKVGLKTVVDYVKYLGQATAHTLTFLRPLKNADNSITRKAAAAVGTTGNITVPTAIGPSGNLLAANDRIGVVETDGVFRQYVVSAVAGSGLSFSVTGNLQVGISAGALIWNFGATGDTDPRTGAPHPAFTTNTGNGTQGNNGITELTGNNYGLLATVGQNEPVLVHSNNAANAGTITICSFGHVQTGA